MKDISEKNKQMTKIYELWRDVYTGDDYEYSSKESLVATYDEGSKKFAEKEAERLREEQKDRGWPDHFHVRAKLIEANYIPDITEVNYYPTLPKALNSLMTADADYTFIRHELSKNEEVKRHKHRNYNEWVIFNHGKLEIMVDSRSQVIDNTDIPEVCSVFFPKNTSHSAKALSETNYYVLRSSRT
jgi:mannose-6-phosphate isomerase-like protein (cupin superfamily)